MYVRAQSHKPHPLQREEAAADKLSPRNAIIKLGNKMH